MRELEIKLTGRQFTGETVVSIDDKPVKFKKNEFGNLVCKYQTENDKINVKVYRLLDVGGFVWFITQLFFFVISIFGIFDIHHRERCFVVDFESEFDLKEENKITLRLYPPHQSEKAIDIETELTFKEISNEYFLDATAKKTLIGLTITKIILALAIIATVVVVLFVKL